MEVTHWIEYDQPKLNGRQQRAVCGRLVLSESFSTTPSCPECKASVKDDEATSKCLVSGEDYARHWGKP